MWKDTFWIVLLGPEDHIMPWGCKLQHHTCLNRKVPGMNHYAGNPRPSDCPRIFESQEVLKVNGSWVRVVSQILELGLEKLSTIRSILHSKLVVWSCSMLGFEEVFLTLRFLCHKTTRIATSSIQVGPSHTPLSNLQGSSVHLLADKDEIDEKTISHNF